MYHQGFDELLLWARHICYSSNYSTPTKYHVKRYENSYIQTHTLRWLLHSFTTVTHYHSVIKSLMMVQKKKKTQLHR